MRKLLGYAKLLRLCLSLFVLMLIFPNFSGADNNKYQEIFSPLFVKPEAIAGKCKVSKRTFTDENPMITTDSNIIKFLSGYIFRPSEQVLTKPESEIATRIKAGFVQMFHVGDRGNDVGIYGVYPVRDTPVPPVDLKEPFKHLLLLGKYKVPGSSDVVRIVVWGDNDSTRECMEAVSNLVPGLHNN